MTVNSIITVFLTLLATTAHGDALEEILSRHAGAMGGVKALTSIRSAVVIAETEVGGMKGTTVTYYQAPDKFRIDLSLPIVSYTQACNGDKCWLRDQQGLTHSLSGDLKGLVVTQMALDRGTYMTPATFDGTITLSDSTATIEGTSCYQLEITPAGGTAATVAIDAQTYLIKRVKVITDLATVYSYPSDYRQVDGVMIPFRSTEATDAGIIAGTNIITSAKLNVDLPDSLFELAENAHSASVNSQSVTVPFDLYRNHIYFNADVPGQGTLRFIFDSGAGGVGLNRDLVEKFKLNRLGQVEARGVGGADVSEVYQLDSLNIAELSLSALPVYAMDLSPLQAAGTKRIDGIIGYDLLSRFAITVNYEDSTLIIHRSSEIDRSGWGSECRLNLDFRLPYIDARVNDAIIGRFRLDTGSGSTIDFNSPFVERNQLLSADHSEYHSVTAVGIGGGSTGLIGQLSALELCDYRIDSVLVNYSTSETGIFSGAQTAGNIGAGILKRFIVTFDYPEEAVYFKPITDFNRINRIHNMAGFAMKKSGETLVVTEILPGRYAAETMKIGDRITAINGRSAAALTVAQADAALIGERNSSVVIDILRGNEKISIDLMLDSLY